MRGFKTMKTFHEQTGSRGRSAPVLVQAELGSPQRTCTCSFRWGEATDEPTSVRLFFYQLSWLVIACFVTTIISPFAAEVNRSSLDSQVNQLYPELEPLYRHLHSNPELSLQEEKTAATIAAQLKSIGFEVSEHIGGHGLVGVLRNGPGKTVLVRTDLDALPVAEQTGLPFASRVRVRDNEGREIPVMHACGHDSHMTAFVGTARLLTDLKQSWKGTLVFIGQPAEERGIGARAMLADGLFQKFPKPDYCLALHVMPDVAVGTVALTEGFALANIDAVDVIIRGAGGHGAWPHLTKDPIVLAAETILALQTLISRERDPLDPAVITVGSIHGGAKHNVIPDEVKLQVTVRCFGDATRQQLLSGIRRVVRGQALSAGIAEDRLPVVKVLDEEFTPSTYNDPALTSRLRSAFQRVLGAENVVSHKPVMGGEDFSEFGRTEEKIPICMFFLGSRPAAEINEASSGRRLASLHSSLYHPEAEPTIKTGMLLMTSAVLDLLK